MPVAKTNAETEFLIRPFKQEDTTAIRDLFIEVNRGLLDQEPECNLDSYIKRSLEEDIGRIADFYSNESGNSFFVAEIGDALAGMFGLERKSSDVVELRRMYVREQFRRRGLARALLKYALRQAHHKQYKTMTLSTSEIQTAAVHLYQSAGFHLIRTEIADETTSRTVGGGIKRYYFDISIEQQAPHWIKGNNQMC